MKTTPRLRMFAGPNGSGKSTIKDVVEANIPGLLGVYINPDEMEKAIRRDGILDLTAFQIQAETSQVRAFFTASSLLQKADLQNDVARINVVDGKLDFDNIEINSYWASVTADFIRHRLLEAGISFTFETVMSSADKVTFLQKAQEQGFRTYLYFVATEDPEINVSRVAYRVKTGGHPVPREKIISRYWRSLDLLPDAISHSNRAYLFDNSVAGLEHVWIAEVTDGEELEMKTEHMPHWFKVAVWDKLGLDEEDIEA